MKKGRLRGPATVFTALLLFSAAALFGNEAEDLMGRIDAKQTSDSSQVRMIMKIIPSDPGATVREYKVESFARGRNDSYMVFLNPRSIRGLRILDLDGDIRVYFPSTGRIRRISGDQKSGSAGGLGGDFSYEDMGSGSYVDDYRLSTERRQDNEMIIRGIPRDPDSTYTHLLFYVDTSDERVFKVEYHEKEGGHVKTLYQREYSLNQGVDMPGLLEMVNHEDQQRTVIEIAAARYNIRIDEKFFHPNRFYR